jgi:hypothetical protein
VGLRATKCFGATWNYDTKIKGFILEAWSLIKSSSQRPATIPFLPCKRLAQKPITRPESSLSYLM